ncbi:hypothetical protein V8D89_001170 [Ganoderma adspersum]
MSDLSCTADAWAQTVTGILGKMSFSVFCALRAYALSNRNKWLAAIITLSALPPSVMLIVCVEEFTILPVVGRGSQLIAELLVVGITWHYTYHSYRVNKGIKMGKTISSRLVYNGCLYFLSLAAIYIVNITLKIALATVVIPTAETPFDMISDSITSILVCRFMLSLRQVNSTIAPATLSVPVSPVREGKASAALEFGAQTTNDLPPFLASFAHPIYVNSDLSETDPDATFGSGSEWEETDQATLTLTTPCSQDDIRPSPGRQTSEAVENRV